MTPVPSKRIVFPEIGTPRREVSVSVVVKVVEFDYGTLFFAAETESVTLCLSVLYSFMVLFDAACSLILSDASYLESPAKCACTVQPEATAFGDAPSALK